MPNAANNKVKTSKTNRTRRAVKIGTGSLIGSNNVRLLFIVCFFAKPRLQLLAFDFENLVFNPQAHRLTFGFLPTGVAMNKQRQLAHLVA